MSSAESNIRGTERLLAEIFIHKTLKHALQEDNTGDHAPLDLKMAANRYWNFLKDEDIQKLLNAGITLEVLKQMSLSEIQERTGLNEQSMEYLEYLQKNV